jgi:hypothetical protein
MRRDSRKGNMKEERPFKENYSEILRHKTHVNEEELVMIRCEILEMNSNHLFTCCRAATRMMREGAWLRGSVHEIDRGERSERTGFTLEKYIEERKQL